LSGIENDTLSQATVLLRWRWKTYRPHAATHGDDVIIRRRRIEDIDLAVLDLVFEFVRKRRGERKRRKKIFHDQCRSVRILD